MKICVMEIQCGPVRSTVSFAIRWVIRAILNKGLVAGHLQRTRMIAVVHLLIIKAVYNALMKNDKISALIAAFVLNYIKKKFDRRRKRKVFNRIKVTGLCATFFLSNLKLVGRYRQFVQRVE